MLPILLLTNACATGGASRNAGCGSFQPIHSSPAVPQPTLGEVLEHNRVGVAICGWKPPARTAREEALAS